MYRNLLAQWATGCFTKQRFLFLFCFFAKELENVLFASSGAPVNISTESMRSLDSTKRKQKCVPVTNARVLSHSKQRQVERRDGCFQNNTCASRLMFWDLNFCSAKPNKSIISLVLFLRNALLMLASVVTMSIATKNQDHSQFHLKHLICLSACHVLF